MKFVDAQLLAYEIESQSNLVSRIYAKITFTDASAHDCANKFIDVRIFVWRFNLAWNFHSSIDSTTAGVCIENTHLQIFIPSLIQFRYLMLDVLSHSIQIFKFSPRLLWTIMECVENRWKAISYSVIFSQLREPHRRRSGNPLEWRWSHHSICWRLFSTQISPKRIIYDYWKCYDELW